MGRITRSKRSQRGITLVEIMVAGVILAIGITAITRFWFVQYYLSNRTDEVSVASHLARMTLENLKRNAPPFDGISFTYYDANENPVDATVATYIVRRDLSTVTSPGSNSYLTTVHIYVTRRIGSQLLCDTTTYRAANGI